MNVTVVCEAGAPCGAEDGCASRSRANCGAVRGIDDENRAAAADIAVLPGLIESTLRE
jgi:hypothetical protein